MIGVLSCYLAGLLAASLLWFATRSSVFRSEVFTRQNYRGHRLPTAVGVLIALSVAPVVALRSLLEPTALAGSGENGWTLLVGDGPKVVALCLAFGVLGFIDDLGGVGEGGGFRGHLRALFEGRVTTGAIKMLGGPVFAVIILAADGPPVDASSTVALLRDAVLIALAANLANLLDRAPGRVGKVAQVCGLVLAAVTLDAHLGAAGVALGAAAALLVGDLRESLMLGDAGANVLGAILGYATVISCSGTGRWVVFGVLVALNALSEILSFSRVIDRFAALRWLDRVGAPQRR